MIKNMWLLLSLSLLLCVKDSFGYGTGAPDSACDGLVPIHPNVSPQATASPYSLQVTDDTDANGAKFTVSIVSGESFQGFLLKANTVGGASTNFVGKFSTIPSGSQRRCGNTGTRGVTHTQQTAKQNLAFVWQPDASDCNTNVQFHVTVARSFSEFWSGIISNSVYVRCTSPITTTASAPVGTITRDSACGVTKGCFHDCRQNAGCTYLVTWQDSNTNTEFEISTSLVPQGDVWAGIALSTDSTMGSDSVMSCLVKNDVVSVEHSYNDGKDNQPISNVNQGLTFTSGSRQNGVVRCNFLRAKSVNGEPKIFDLNTDWIILFATGPLDQSGRILKHRAIPVPSAQAADFQTTEDLGAGRIDYPLVKAHACFMILAWVLSSSIGIVIARYYKSEWPERTILGLKVWFQIHRLCMISALVCTLIAFVVIFVESGGYSDIVTEDGKGYLKAHPVLGIIVTILVIVNPIMAIFRPNPDHEKRPIFNWSHRLVGTIAQGLSAITILFGFELGKASAPASATGVMIAFIITFVAVEVLLEVMQCYCKKQNTGRYFYI
ncbi:hypothetical protein KUTeg_007833 [Tegillarca granosa]|uniref:Ferric-chelate reductase 1 n=1 Tax=Tegillarca granosa TaxID=220873 RepID=A0ABQ9FED3_TEGGR|nr:hypothetical protein KUTeg_007833 [Tegillarca granosa]